MTVIDSSSHFRASPPVFFHEHAMRMARAYKNPTMCRQPATLQKAMAAPGRTDRRARVKPASRAAVVEAVTTVRQLARAASKSVSTGVMSSMGPSSNPEPAAGAQRLPRTKTVRRDPALAARVRAEAARSTEPQPLASAHVVSGGRAAEAAGGTSASGVDGSVVQGEVVSAGAKPLMCRSPSPSVSVALPVDPPPAHRDDSEAALCAFAAAGESAVRAQAAGVDIASSPGIRRLFQIAQIPVAFVDLIAATALALVSLGTCRSAAVMAANHLKVAIDAVNTPLPQEAAVVAARPASNAAVSQVQADANTPALVAITRARESLQVAKRQASVDMARSAFLNRLLGVGVATLAVGLSIAATVLTGGLGGVALLLSALLLRQAIANAHCAWQNKEAVESGKPPLPMGTSALANAMHAHYRKHGLTPEQAHWQAAKVSAICSTIVAGAGFTLGATITTVLPLAAKCVRAICSVTAAVLLHSADHLRSGAVKANLNEHQRLLEREIVQPYLERWMREKDAARLQLVAQLAPNMPSQRSAADEAQALAAELRRWELRAPSAIVVAQELAARHGVEPLPDDAGSRKLRAKSETVSAFNWAVPTWISASGAILNVLI